MKPDIAYNEMPLLPPAAEIETKQVLRQAITANTELAKLKGYCSLLPNETILLNSIVLKEARTSSEIENIITTQDDLYRAMVQGDHETDPETKEVLNYRSATWLGYDELEKKGSIGLNTILAVQKELEGNSAGIRKVPGTVLANDQSGEVIYTPPDNEQLIMKLMTNLEEYVHIEDGTDPLIKMAIIHFQFESIHPFYDGNGRTGRILNVLYLVYRGLLDSPILYLSEYFIRNKNTYYELLQRVRTEEAWEEWILFVLKAVEVTSRSTLEIISAIMRLMNETIELCRQRLPKSSYSKELVELLFIQPYTKIDFLVRENIAERRTASKYLKQLEEIGILESFKAWKETIYVNKKLYELLKG